MHIARVHVSRITSAGRFAARILGGESGCLVSSISSSASIASPSQGVIPSSVPPKKILAISFHERRREGDRTDLPIAGALRSRPSSSSMRGQWIAFSASKITDIASITTHTHDAIGFADHVIRGK